MHALGGAFGGALLRATRACGLVTVFEKNDVPGFYCCAGRSSACVGRPVKKAGSVCAKVELEVGGLLPRTDGRETLWRARCAHSGKGALSVSHKEHTTVAGKEARRAREEEERRVLQQRKHQWQAPCQGTAKRAAGKRSRATVTCHCNKERQTSESTRRSV